MTTSFRSLRAQIQPWLPHSSVAISVSRCDPPSPPSPTPPVSLSLCPAVTPRPHSRLSPCIPLWPHAPTPLSPSPCVPLCSPVSLSLCPALTPCPHFSLSLCPLVTPLPYSPVSLSPQKEQKQELLRGLAGLPQPKNDYEIVVPEGEGGDDGGDGEASRREDRADVDARSQAHATAKGQPTAGDRRPNVANLSVSVQSLPYAAIKKQIWPSTKMCEKSENQLWWLHKSIEEMAEVWSLYCAVCLGAGGDEAVLSVWCGYAVTVYWGWCVVCLRAGGDEAVLSVWCGYAVTVYWGWCVVCLRAGGDEAVLSVWCGYAVTVYWGWCVVCLRAGGDEAVLSVWCGYAVTVYWGWCVVCLRAGRDEAALASRAAVVAATWWHQHTGVEADGPRPAGALTTTEGTPLTTRSGLQIIFLVPFCRASRRNLQFVISRQIF